MGKSFSSLLLSGLLLASGNAFGAKVHWTYSREEGPEHWATLTPEFSSNLLPSDRDYYRFNGSLTTPPCTEGVRWLVLKTPVSVSREQVAAFSKVMHHPNNRSIQPVNARPVLQ